MRFRGRRLLFALSLLAGWAACVAFPTSARAITVYSGPTTTLTTSTAGATGTYTWGVYRTAGTENVSGFTVVFPAGTNVSGATSTGQPGTVSVTTNTVTVTFTTRIARNTNFSISLGSIVNPPAGSYTASLTLTVTNTAGNNPVKTSVSTAAYTIKPVPPHLTLTITTPAATQTVNFGSVNPGVAAASQTVTVTVDSTANFTITRTASGQVAQMGLSFSTLPTGTQTPGVHVYSDVYTVTPPWTTTPASALTASVIYTVTQ